MSPCEKFDYFRLHFNKTARLGHEWAVDIGLYAVAHNLIAKIDPVKLLPYLEVDYIGGGIG